MGGRALTKLSVIILSGLVAVVDLVLIGNGKESISSYLYTTSREYPVIALVAGILAGHIFWPVRSKQ
jgi:hypothetical protein